MITLNAKQKWQKTKTTERLKILKLGTVGLQQRIQHILGYELQCSGSSMNLHKLLMRILTGVLSAESLTTQHTGVLLLLWKALNYNEREKEKEREFSCSPLEIEMVL